MEERLHSLDSRITAVEAALREGNDRFRRMEIAQKDNTDITTQTRDAVAELNKRVGEPLAYFDKAMMGLRVLGGIGVAGMWLVRRWYLVLAVGVALRVLFAGGSVTEAWNGMLRMLQLGTH